MNEIKPIAADYIQNSKTIETLVLTNGRKTQVCYIYNYEGVHFRYFDNVLNLLQFFQYGENPEHCFDNEDELDSFLLSKEITDDTKYY